MMSDSRAKLWRYHPERDRLLAEAHARPFTPLKAPMLATRIATLSGQDGAASDRSHMTALCRSLGRSEPGPDARWCVLDAGKWRLRWERHTEFSTWTFFRSPDGDNLMLEKASDAAPKDWIDSLPGEVLVATNLVVISKDSSQTAALIARHDSIGAIVLEDAARVFTDLRPDPDRMTSYLLVMSRSDDQLAGRLALSLLEIETYRMMALLAFPLAGEATELLTGIEAEAGHLASQLSQTADADADRALLARLATLAGETEALSARTSFRFGAATAYHEIVLDRIETIQEMRISGLQTLGEFMERRLAPAMRTCDTVARRQQAAIERIARTEQMLNTRVEVATEATNVKLLESMDSRAKVQLRLQGAVEGFSVFAIAYYALSLASYPLKAIEKTVKGFDATLAAGVLAPILLIIAWRTLKQFRKRANND
jgi:uncharacterized membrane-anchored protein